MRPQAATLFLSLLWLLGACQSEPAAPGSAARGRGPYFDVRGLLDGQVRALSQRQPAVEKTVALRGGGAEIVRVPRVRWAEELQIFYQADLNKAALRGAYQADSARLPGGALRRTYQLRPGFAHAPVQRLEVLELPADQATQLHATLQQENPLFTARKQLHLTLQKGQLAGYSVQGVQKLVFFDTLRYQTAARVQ